MRVRAVVSLILVVLVLWFAAGRYSTKGRLVRAILKNDAAAVESILKEKPGLATSDIGGTTALHHACGVPGATKIVQSLLDKGADVNRIPDTGSTTPLVWAVKPDNAATMKLLLEHGARPNLMTKKGVTALHVAAWRGNVTAVRLLIEHGSDPNIKSNSEEHFTPLHCAARFENPDVAEALLESGAKINELSEEGTPLQVAIRHKRNRMLDLLLQRGAGIETPDALGSRPLHTAARFGNIDAAKKLIAARADVNARGAHDVTPLITAVLWEQYEMVVLLLGNGADPHLRDDSNASPYLHAVVAKNRKIIEVLEVYEDASAGP